MKRKKYEEGYELLENEFLLKVRDDGVGFLTKFNKDGSMPVAFKNWKSGRYPTYPTFADIMIEIEIEFPRVGWTLVSWRIGKSQEWAVMRHPNGYIVEIYLSNFLEIIKTNTLINGEIEGLWQWKNNKLIK